MVHLQQQTTRSNHKNMGVFEMAAVGRESLLLPPVYKFVSFTFNLRVKSALHKAKAYSKSK